MKCRLPLVWTCLVSALVATSAKADDPGGTEEAAQPPDYEALIDGLANRNSKPKLVNVGPGRLPLFPDDFDWEEQQRAIRAQFELFRNEDVAVWEHFLKHLDDDRYACTLYRPPFHSENSTVGDLCRRAAWARLDFAKYLRDRGDDPDGADARFQPAVHLDVGVTDLVEWRRRWPEKSLYELQVEVCEAALRQLAKKEGISLNGRRRIKRDLQKTLTTLKHTQEPIFYRPFGERDYFTPKLAQKVRDRINEENRGSDCNSRSE